MAHVAQLNESNEVIQVIVVSNDYEPNVEDFASNLFGGTWVQTSYSGSIRKNFAGIGHHYDPVNDCFYAPQPFPSWILNTDAQWEAPVPRPSEGYWNWNEELGEWVEAEII